MATATSPLPGYELTAMEGMDPSTGKIYTEQDSGFTNYLRHVNRWTDALYEEGKEERKNDIEYKSQDRYLQYFLGNQWPKGRPSYRSRATSNRVWRLIWELLAQLTDVRPFITVSSNNKAYDDIAKLNENACKSWWYANDADQILMNWIMFGMFGTSFARLTWQQDLCNGKGDQYLEPCGMDSVMVVKPYDNNIQNAQAVIYEKAMPLGWFRWKWPIRGRFVKPDSGLSSFTVETDNSGMLSPISLDSLTAAGRRLLGANETKHMISTRPMAWYREFHFKDWSFNESNRNLTVGDPSKNWSYIVKPGQPMYPRGRLVIKGGDLTLWDGPNPYWHAKYPFTPMRLNPVPWTFHGLSEFRSMIQLQDILNQIVAGVVEMIQKSLNPLFYAPRNALSDAVWQNFDPSMPGARLAYNIASPQKPEFQQPPNVPAYVLQVFGIVSKEMSEASGLQSVSDAAGKKQIPGAEGLEMIKQAKQTTVRLKGRQIEVAMRDVGAQFIPNFMQFTPLGRRIQMFGEKGITSQDYDADIKTLVPAGTDPAEFVRDFPMTIKPGSLLKLNHIEDAVIFANLRKNRDISLHSLYEKMDIGLDADQEITRIKEEMAQMPPPPPTKGKH